MKLSKLNYLVLLSFLCQINLTSGGQFVVWCPMSAKSVKIGLMEVGEGLARRGHEVTVVSPHKYKKVPDGVTEIIVESETFERFSQSFAEDILTNPDAGMSGKLLSFVTLSMDLNREALNSTKVKELLQKKIDVMITIPAFGNEVAYYLAMKTNASLVPFITASNSFPNINFDMGDPYNPSYMPNPILGYTQKMTFGQRLINTLVTAAYLIVRQIYILPEAEKLLHEAFPEDEIPSLNELGKNSALFINHGTPFTGDGLRPTMPKTIMAGLMSCSPAKPLPENLESFITNSKDGVIFVSFGSVLKASKMPESKRLMMLSVFSKLKQRVIWKWETDMGDAPPNVMLSSWLPQTSLLAHPNVRLFITHGGAGSIQETICHKTPIVGVPINGDQIVNIKEAVNKKIGVHVDWYQMTEEILAEAINQVLDDSSFQTSVTDLSDLIMDQPLHPLDRSIWWLEYLLRHPHNPGMRPVTHDLYWFQYFLIDVLLFFLVMIMVTISIVYKFFRYLCCLRKSKQD